MKLKCSCTNKGQDELNGKQVRVFNETKKTSMNEIVYRCTVCLHEKTK